MKPSLLYRKLGDGGVLFNERTWNTHILTPAAAIIYEALVEQANDAPIPLEQAIRFLKAELDLDPSAPEIQKLLMMFRRLKLLE